MCKYVEYLKKNYIKSLNYDLSLIFEQTIFPKNTTKFLKNIVKKEIMGVVDLVLLQ